jgi:DNA helicase II / ATP-dependent DNA helicase PcrA
MSVAESGDESFGQELERERAINELYQRMLNELAKRSPNSGNGPLPRVPSFSVGPIVGRVGLDRIVSLLGQGFYLGPWHQEIGTVQVISWAAPVASLFYDGPRSGDAAAEHVAARRTYVVDYLDIVGFTDDGDPSVFKTDSTSEGELQVPRPLRPVQRPTRPREAAPRARVTPVAPKPVLGAATTKKQLGEPSAPRVTEPTTAMRAEAVVRETVERPRTGRLNSVLATLQPDQYRLVTWPDDRLLVVQGQPGTGKTIVATHRAAYLTHPDREDPPPLLRVALIGPTDQYRQHVATVVTDVGAQDVDVLSLPGFLRQVADVGRPGGVDPDDRLDTAWSLGRLVDRAAAALERHQGRLKPTDAARRLVRALAKREHPVQPLIPGDPELGAWLDQLKSWEHARGDVRYLPFLAAVRQAVKRPPASELYQHLVIDEAQDVRPLEWKILLGRLAPGGMVSLFGDVHQRRSDWSEPSWEQLVETLDMNDETQFAPEVLDIGYRSTQRILEFANQLLPRSAREAHSLRMGLKPTVTKVKHDEIVTAATAGAIDLLDCHSAGLVAVIAMEPRRISDRFRQRGWSRGALEHSWSRDGRTVIVLHPSNARGLEFDGVVVVEPADFPMNVGRLGLLYTSLSRATQELTVVHSKPLPKPLRSKLD